MDKIALAFLLVIQEIITSFLINIVSSDSLAWFTLGQSMTDQLDLDFWLQVNEHKVSSTRRHRRDSGWMTDSSPHEQRGRVGCKHIENWKLNIVAWNTIFNALNCNRLASASSRVLASTPAIYYVITHKDPIAGGTTQKTHTVNQRKHYNSLVVHPLG